MIKKIFGCVFIIFTLLSGTVSVLADIMIEGEDYNSTVGGHVAALNDGALSGGRYVSVQYDSGVNDHNEIIYNVYADKEGWYSLNIDSTAGDSEWTSNYMLSVNGEGFIDVKSDAKINSSSSDAFFGLMRKVDMGCVYMKKGRNVIKIVVDEKRKADSQICFYLDKMTFSTPTYGVRKIVPHGDLNIFEGDRDVKYDIILNYPEAKEEKYNFVLENYWGEKIDEGTITVAPNSKKYVLNLGSIDNGWYKLNIKDSKGTEIYSDFLSVVPAVDERIKIDDSPFAMDFASGFETFLREKMDSYVRALKLCGPSMVRERIHWGTIEQGEEAISAHDVYINKLSDAGLKIYGCTHGSEQKGADNLFDVYTAAKTAVQHFDGKIQAWEFGNEPELAFWADPADKYSTYVKAASLGTRDSGIDVLHSSGGMTEPTNILSGGCGDFIELFMMNDTMKFVDIFPYHSYATDHHLNIASKQTATHDKNKREGGFIYGNGKPIWLTEGGLMYVNDMVTDVTRESQARAIVKIMVESVVQGDSKHFWFVFGPRREHLGDFGCFDINGRVLPSYSAFANMTNMLGSGEYKGRMINIPEYVDGYIFNNSQKDVAVMWGDRPAECKIKSPEGIVVTDLMGVSNFISADEDGNCRVVTSQSPVYITFPSGVSADTFMPDTDYVKTYQRTPLSDSERIIVDPIFTGEIEAKAKIAGYSIKETNSEQMLLNVYNFNNKEISGVLKIEVGEGFELSRTEIPVVIPSMGRIQESVYISLSADAIAGNQAYLSYKVVTAEGESTPTVSSLYVDKEPEEVEPDMIIPNSDNPDMWDVTNILAGSNATAKATDEGIDFSINFASGDKWFYPKLRIEDASFFGDKTGVCYHYYADAELAKSGSTMYIMVWLEDGRQYFLDARVPFEEGWHQIQRSWDSFTLMSSPLGALDIRQFDPTLIKDFSIGTNASIENFKYIIRDIGVYTKDGNAENDKFIVGGIEDGGIYKEGCIPEVIVQVPYKTDLDSISVKTGTIPYSNYKIEDEVIKIDLNDLKRGYHSLYVYGRREEMSHYRRTVINITVE